MTNKGLRIMDVNIDSKPIKAVRAAMDWWQILGLIGVALGGAVAAIIVGLREYIVAWLERMTKGVKQYYADRLQKVGEYMAAIDMAKLVKGVERIVIFRGRNGGGKPTPGKIYSVRGMMAWARLKENNPEDRYDFETPADKHHIDVLVKMLQDGVTEIEFKDMPLDSKLRVYYQNEGVMASRMYFLTLYGDEMIFISLASFSRLFNTEDRIQMDIAVDRIRASML